MATDRTRRQIGAALRRLSSVDEIDATAFREEALALLRRAIGFDGWCWMMVDPATGLPADTVADNSPITENRARWHQLTYADRVPTPADARSEVAVSVLSEAARRDLPASQRWTEVLAPAGVGDTLEAHLVSEHLRWGHLSLYRGADSGWFTTGDRAFVAELAPLLAVQLRRSIRTASASDSLDDLEEPGTLVLGPDLCLLAISPDAQRWLHEVAPTPPHAGDPLPTLVYALAARVGAGAGAEAPSARVRVRSAAGRWVVLRGGLLSSTAPAVPARSIVVTLEAARSTEIAPLLMQAWGLSTREREVASLVLDGLATDEIATELFISSHTVRDHIRSVFDKVGVRSRRHLVSALATGSLSAPTSSPQR